MDLFLRRMIWPEVLDRDAHYLHNSFFLTVETLAIRLKSSKEIHGFKIGKDKKVQHADSSTNTL